MNTHVCSQMCTGKCNTHTKQSKGETEKKRQQTNQKNHPCHIWDAELHKKKEDLYEKGNLMCITIIGENEWKL